MGIVAVGHTPQKMDRLMAMLPSGISRVAIFNGHSARQDATHVENDPVGLDIKMYRQGLEKVEGDRFVFLNDDMIHLGDPFWDLAREFLAGQHEFEVAGVANLSHWIDYAKCNEKQKLWHQRRGRALHFLRTSAFLATREYFDRVYAAAEGKAQVFEKLTLKLAQSHKLINPDDAYDSNIEPFLDLR